jgi:hypothetical protein
MKGGARYSALLLQKFIVDHRPTSLLDISLLLVGVREFVCDGDAVASTEMLCEEPGGERVSPLRCRGY